MTKLHLRVLYTINSSPQYILARSNSLLPVTPISQQPNSQQKYATVSLKACLGTICRSSPELIQDNNRDYSVYVLDPLESNSAPAPISISNSSARNTSMKAQEKTLEQPYGVAVGLGLMSWALHADENDGALVTGTQVRLNTGQDALEVIFALRETAAMQRTSLSSTMRSWGLPLGVSSQSTLSMASASSTTVDPNMLSLTSATSKHNSRATTTAMYSQSQAVNSSTTDESLAVIQALNKGKSRTKRVSKPSTIPTTESDKLMYASETYIGPLKKKGRPKNSSNGKVSKASDKDNSSVQDAGLQSSPHGIVRDAGSQVEKPVTRHSTAERAPPIQLQAVGVPSMGVSIQSQDFLMSILSSGAGTIQNAAVLAALSKIDSSAIATQTIGEQEHNPALIDALRQLLSVYTKQSSQTTNPQSYQQPDSHGAIESVNQDEDVVILDKENVDPLAFRRRGDRDSSDIKAIGLTQSTISNNYLTENLSHTILSQKNEQVNTGNIRRKRTLSDFMDEKESERNKQREKERSERKEQRRHSRVRRTSSSSSIYESNLSGLRHYPRLLAGEPLPRPGMNSYYRKSLETRSSPPRPGMNSHRLETWSSPPRLKADATSDVSDTPLTRRSDVKVPISSPSRRSPTLASRKRYIVPEWARTNTATQPRLSEEAQRALEEAEEQKRQEREAAKRKSSLTHRRPKQTDLKAKQTRMKTSESAPPPTVATNDACPVFAASDTSSDILSSLSWSTDGPSSPHSPLSLHIPRTPPQKCSMPLFTPENGSSSLFTPTPKAKSVRRPGSIGSRPGKSPESPSPSVRIQMSPIQAIVSGRSVGGAGEWNGSADEDNGWGEIDGPLSSLPTASDGEDDVPTSSSFDVEIKMPSPDGSIGDEDLSVKQHWIGLPPSSPPPPSSPILTQEQDDGDMELPDLPALTSDTEESTSPAVDIYPENQQDAEDMFDPLLSSLSSEGPMPSDMDIFTHLSADFENESNTPALDASLESILQNGLVDFDFTEFWESFKPIVGGNISETAKVESGVHSDMNLDHIKLAEDVQALFSGCLM